MQVTLSSFSNGSAAQSKAVSQSTEKNAEKQQGTGSVEENFLKYLQKSPAERMFENWLASQKMTKEQFDAMSPEEKQKLIEKFKREMQEELKRKYNLGQTGGAVVNVSA